MSVKDLQPDRLRIRDVHFTQEFWDKWEILTQRQRDTYSLSLIVELEGLLKELQRKLSRVEEELASYLGFD
jgi:hypothetical protein